MTVRRPHVHVVRVALVAAVVAIVLGILGMHALNLHEAATTAPMSGMAGMAGHGEAAEASSVSGDVSQPTVGVPSQPGHDMGDMVMLCTAMLVAAGFALVALLLRRLPTSSWVFTRSQLTTRLRRLVAVLADTGPPPVWAFSVIRC